ncbi:dual specificity protein phosphatase 23-like [Tubulanus polymorphus]|uniref:dual specificity protein phosphatase 23-like n=1 Tax=Tubulanus polymorphus TaxID=672921 RepID=UPI003DA1E0CE
MMGKFPPYFSWVIEGLLAALAFPSQPEHIEYLKDNNIKHLVSLTAERIPKVDGFPDINWTHIPIKDFTAPTLPQVDEFVKLLDYAKKENEAVAVHCAAGRGRTGTMIASYLIKEYGLPAEEAITKTRSLRPGSIETKDQEKLVHTYYDHIKTCSNSQNVESDSYSFDLSLHEGHLASGNCQS